MGKQVAGRHSLHKNAAFINVILFLHQINKTQRKVAVRIVLDVNVLDEVAVLVLLGRAAGTGTFKDPCTGSMCIGENADKTVTLRYQHPGGINRMPPSRHQPAMVADYQRCLFCGVIGGRNVFVPGSFHAIERVVEFTQPLRIAVRTVAVFVDGHICPFNGSRQVVAIGIIWRSRQQLYSCTHI